MTFALEDLRRGLALLEGMKRRIVCHPELAGRVQAEIDQIPGTLDWVTVTSHPYCPRDKILVFKGI